MPSNHLILCRPLLLPPSILPSIRVFSHESVRHIMWPKLSFTFNISPSNEYSGLISLRMEWLNLLAVQGTLKSLLQHHSSKASILWHSAFFRVQLSYPHMTAGKTIALTRQTYILYKSESLSVVSHSLWLRGLYSPWNSSGQNTAVGSHYLLQAIFPTHGLNPGLSVCLQFGRPRFNPCVGKIPWRRKWQPTPVVLPGKIPWTEDPGRLQSMGSQRVRHNWATSLSFLTHCRQILYQLSHKGSPHIVYFCLYYILLKGKVIGKENRSVLFEMGIERGLTTKGGNLFKGNEISYMLIWWCYITYTFVKTHKTSPEKDDFDCM